MAKETKSLTVPPSEEAAQIELWQAFGYELFSTQEVLAKDSHLEQGMFNTINSVTETTHYIKLTFQRDTNIPHYAEYRALENEFNNVPYPGDYPTTFSIVQIFIGLMLCTVPGVFMIVKNIMATSQRPQWEARYSQYVQERQKILEKAYAVAES